jgi:hypothetical protein
MRNARFWVWWNGGWVKLALEPGQQLTVHYGGRTEEGWSYTTETWTHDGEAVVVEADSEACDCDGRLDRSSIFMCPLDKLQAVSAYEDYKVPENVGIYKPQWERLSASQRDHEAEKAGY